MNVFIFPTRNEPGLEIIHALSKSNKFELFGGSSYEMQYDPARNLLRNYVLCPGYRDEDFRERFCEILAANKIDLVFPAWDPLVAIFSEWHVPGVAFITPRPDIAKLLLSKQDTYLRLRDHVPVPRMYPPDDAPLPCFAKPDRDSGSRGVMEITTPNLLRMAIEQNLLLCEYLPGEEYTVDCISDLDGRLLFANVRHRARIGRGIALGAVGVHHPRIQHHVEKIAKILHVEGPWFAQFKENGAGEPVLMEINARIAGSMGLTRMCGINIPLMSAFLFTGHALRVPQARAGVLVNRALSFYVDHEPFEAVIWDWDDTLIRKDGKPDPAAVACLYDLHNRGIRQWLVTKNPNVDALMERHQIPRFFEATRVSEDKAAALNGLLREYDIEPTRCVLVNDSYTERFQIESRHPLLRVVTPDALEYLGRERFD